MSRKSIERSRPTNIYFARPKHLRRGVTLIEILIVVAIVSILAAIAVPNYLEAQVRSKVARAKADMRTIATALEAFRVDKNGYPEGTDNPALFPPKVAAALGGLAPGFYALRTQGSSGEIAGKDFATLTTPVAYIHTIPDDPFARKGFTHLPYAYRNSKRLRSGWIITSAGPDTDLWAAGGVGNTNASNAYSTAADTKTPARLADINERAVIHAFEGTANDTVTNADREQLEPLLAELTYDPSNGTVSDGDLFRMMGRILLDQNE